MSTGFIWLCTQTFRWHRCTTLSDAFRPSFWNSYTDSFSTVWTVQLLITTHNIIPLLAKTMLLLCGQEADIRPRQNSSVVISVWWRHWTEILLRNSQLKPQAHCVRAAYSVTLWNPVQLGNSESYEARSFSVNVTALTLLNTLVLDLGLVEVLQSQELFLFILYFRSLNIRIDFNIIFPSNSSSKHLNKYLIISLIISLTFPSVPSVHRLPLTFPTFPNQPPNQTVSPLPAPSTIPLTQSAVNTQSK